MGRLVVIEGVDGCGKTTCAKLLEAAILKEGAKACVFRDPGTTNLGEEIRNIVLHRKDLQLSLSAETLLFMAARAQMTEELITPALREYDYVILDRFYLSTIAYQGAQFLQKQGIAGFDWLYNLIDKVHGDVPVEQWVFLDLPLAKLTSRNHVPDKMSGRGDDYMKSVWNCYHVAFDRLVREPKFRNRCTMIDAEFPQDYIVDGLMDLLGFKHRIGESSPRENAASAES